MQIIRKASERGHVNIGWLNSHHSFSFGDYYDPNHMGFSDLRVINDDRVAASAGFATHPHRDMEILSYILEGAIAHKDSMGNVETVPAGEFQIMSAGTGITHSEYNPDTVNTLHLLQIWIKPNILGVTPRYEQKAFADKEGATLILSPNGDHDSLMVYQDMKLWRHQYASGTSSQTITLNGDRNYWLHMVKGVIKAGRVELSAGDALAVSGESVLQLDIMAQSEFLLFDLK
jgi:redox-sensitive bicupin YhaK (pirin superfamily)